MGIFGPRESIGDAAALQGGSYPGSAIATSPNAEVVQIGADLMRAAMARDPRVADAMQQALLQHTRALQTKIDIMTAGSVPARLASVLLHLADRFGDEDESGVTRVGIVVSRAAMARLVSARVETVIRALSAFQRDGRVEWSDDGFAIASQSALRDVLTKG